MKNFKLFIIIVLVAVMVLAGCKAQVPEASAIPAATEKAEQESLVLTLEELSEYNGENGNPAYIAVDGVIYDVSNVIFWKGGKHNGFTAGKDLTNEIKTVSPHGTSKLKGVPVVGKLAE